MVLIGVCFSCFGSLYNTKYNRLNELWRNTLRNDLDKDVVRLYLGLNDICEELKQTGWQEISLTRLYTVDAKLEQFLIFARLDTILELEHNTSPQDRVLIVSGEFWDAGLSELPAIYQAMKCFRNSYVKPLIVLIKEDKQLTEEQLASWMWAKEQVCRIAEETAKIKRGSSEDYLKPDQSQLSAVRNAVKMSLALISRKPGI